MGNTLNPIVPNSSWKPLSNQLHHLLNQKPTTVLTMEPSLSGTSESVCFPNDSFFTHLLSTSDSDCDNHISRRPSRPDRSRLLQQLVVRRETRGTNQQRYEWVGLGPSTIETPIAISSLGCARRAIEIAFVICNVNFH